MCSVNEGSFRWCSHGFELRGGAAESLLERRGNPVSTHAGSDRAWVPNRSVKRAGVATREARRVNPNPSNDCQLSTGEYNESALEDGPSEPSAGYESSFWVLFTRKDVAAALQQAEECERQQIQECLRRLDHYDRCLQAVRGDLTEDLPFESAMVVSRADYPSIDLASLSELARPSIPLPRATPRPSFSLGVEQRDPALWEWSNTGAGIIAEAQTEAGRLSSSGAIRPDPPERSGGIKARMSKALRPRRTRSRVALPTEWDWKSQALFVQKTRHDWKRGTGSPPQPFRVTQVSVTTEDWRRSEMS